MVTRAGAEIDGVLYFDTGLFARRQRQQTEFEQIARRFGRNSSELTLISRDQALLEAADRSGLRIQPVERSPIEHVPAADNFKTALANID